MVAVQGRQPADTVTVSSRAMPRSWDDAVSNKQQEPAISAHQTGEAAYGASGSDANAGLIGAVMAGNPALGSKPAPVSSRGLDVQLAGASEAPQTLDSIALSLPNSPWPRRHPSFEGGINRDAIRPL